MFYNIEGDYIFYYDSDNYFLLYQADTFWINKHVITVKFNDTITTSERNSFCSEYSLTLTGDTPSGYYDYNLANTSNFITICNSIYYDSRVEKIEFAYKVFFTARLLKMRALSHTMAITLINGILRDYMSLKPGRLHLAIKMSS